MLSEKLSMSNYLTAGEEYTFTFDIKQLFFFASEEKIKQEFQASLGSLATVNRVYRPLFSGYMLITIIPSQRYTLTYWIEKLDAIWKKLRYESDFVQAEGGTTSTSPGGVQQAVPALTKAVGAGTYAAIEPFLPWLFVAGAAYIFINSYVHKKL